MCAEARQHTHRFWSLRLEILTCLKSIWDKKKGCLPVPKAIGAPLRIVGVMAWPTESWCVSSLVWSRPGPSLSSCMDCRVLEPGPGRHSGLAISLYFSPTPPTQSPAPACFITLLQSYPVSSSQCNEENKAKQSKKQHTEWKAILICRGHNYLENLKDSTNKPRKTNEKDQQDHRMQDKYKKSILLLYTSNELVTIKTRNAMPFISAPKKGGRDN